MSRIKYFEPPKKQGLCSQAFLNPKKEVWFQMSGLLARDKSPKKKSFIQSLSTISIKSQKEKTNRHSRSLSNSESPSQELDDSNATLTNTTQPDEASQFRASLGSSFSSKSMLQPLHNNRSLSFQLPKIHLKRRNSVKSERSENESHHSEESSIQSHTRIEEEDIMRSLQTPRPKKKEDQWAPNPRFADLPLKDVKLKGTHSGSQRLNLEATEMAKEVWV